MLETNLKYEPEEQVGPFDDKKQKLRKMILSKSEEPSRFTYCIITRTFFTKQKYEIRFS
jgi:hypothetical protein